MKRIIIVLTILVFAVSGCQQEPNTSVGNEDEYIKFNIDGQAVQINGCGNGGGLLSDGALNSGDTLYQFVGGINSGTCGITSSAITANIHISRLAEALQERNYSYVFSASGGDTLNEFFFYSADPNVGSYASLGTVTTGNVAFTSIEKSVGGYVTGTFNFQNVGFKNVDDSLISSGYTVSDGEFKIKVFRVDIH